MKRNEIKRAIAAMLAALAMAACQRAAQDATKTTNDNFWVELLFENDGVKVYRFWDGRYIYYVDARGRTAWDETHVAGKAIYVEHREVETR